jgi:ATP synthase mitochondrial F1 complex assembly factor 1
VSKEASPKQPSSTAPPGIKTLSSYLDVEKTLSLPPKEIEVIWRLRHSNNPQSLCAVIPSNTFKRMSENARHHPQFILPLPKEGSGAQIHFLQWTWPHKDTVSILFTYLAEYQLRGEYATPHTTITLHTELLAEKGVVLAQGIVQDNRGVSVEEAKWLLMCLQKFYGFEGDEGSEARKSLMEQFSRGDENFNLEQLLEEAERI